MRNQSQLGLAEDQWREDLESIAAWVAAVEQAVDWHETAKTQREGG